MKKKQIRKRPAKTVSLGMNQKFLAIIERSRSRLKKEGGISSGEMRRRLGLDQPIVVSTFRELNFEG